jgi:hypothetical protein
MKLFGSDAGSISSPQGLMDGTLSRVIMSLRHFPRQIHLGFEANPRIEFLRRHFSSMHPTFSKIRAAATDFRPLVDAE